LLAGQKKRRRERERERGEDEKARLRLAESQLVAAGALELAFLMPLVAALALKSWAKPSRMKSLWARSAREPAKTKPPVFLQRMAAETPRPHLQWLVRPRMRCHSRWTRQAVRHPQT
jgi:hypothetical protein